MGRLHYLLSLAARSALSTSTLTGTLLRDRVGDAAAFAFGHLNKKLIRFAGAVYVLHAFQKKSKSGIKTPKQEIDLVRDRLKRAEEHYRAWRKEQKDQKP